MPLSKLLFGSDAYTCLSFIGLQRNGESFVSQALAVYVREGVLTRWEALEGAQLILFKNNRTLFNLPQ